MALSIVGRSLRNGWWDKQIQVGRFGNRDDYELRREQMEEAEVAEGMQKAYLTSGISL